MAFAWLKGHGTENDFVLLPDADGSVHGALDPAFVAGLCDRRRGIGADGVLRVIRTDALRTIDAAAAQSESEWFMDYRNADGSVSEMCGNGIRVFAKYLIDEGLATSPVTIGTRAGDRLVTANADGTYSATMGSFDVPGTRTKIFANGLSWEATKVDVGNPHAVVFVDDLADAGPLLEAPEHDPRDFPAGVNVEFVVRRGPHHIAMRVHERGSGETRSCGTGACAAAIVTQILDMIAKNSTDVWDTYRVDVPGGLLHVTMQGGDSYEVPDDDEDDEVLILTGPAEIVARGELEWLR